MKTRIYLAPLIGDGSAQDAFRSKLNTYIDVAAGERFEDYLNVPRLYSIAVCEAADETHAAIAADAEIQVLSPLCADRAALRAWLTQPWSDLASGTRTAALNRLEALGVSTSWIGDNNTVGEVLNYAFRMVTLMQRARGRDRSDELIALLKANLATTVGQLPSNVRTKAGQWMQARGLATGWINNQTTVREVAHFIATNLGLGKVTISGAEI